MLNVASPCCGNSNEDFCDGSMNEASGKVDPENDADLNLGG